jgi:DUF1680 family protein
MLYSAGRATFQLRRRDPVQIYSESTYPESGEVLLHVEPAHPTQMSIRLRVPEWAKSFSADIQGSHLLGKPGDFLTITREWRRGDTLRINIDLTTHSVAGSGEYVNQIAVFRGPQLLAFIQSLNPQIHHPADLVLDSSLLLKPTAPDAKLPGTWAGNEVFTTSASYAGNRSDVLLVPFSDAIDYRVWLKTR